MFTQRSRALLVLLVGCLLPSILWADAAPPSRGGQIVADPVGFKDIVIAREKLHIDLRPLASGNAAVPVEAVYHLDNRGQPCDLDLVFALGTNLSGSFKVWFDDAGIQSEPSKLTETPKSWQPPKTTPRTDEPGDVAYMPYQRKGSDPMAFRVHVPAGQHVLRVTYNAHAAAHTSHGTTRYHQFAYILAPAREWAGFGGLDVRVDVPAGWLAASEPALERNGDVLEGHFSEIPADALAITIQAPESASYHTLSVVGQAAFGVAGIGGAVLCLALGCRRGRRTGQVIATNPTAPWTDRAAWPLALLLGFLWMLAVVSAAFFAILAPDSAIPEHQANWNTGYGTAFAMLGTILLAPVILLAGFLLTQVTAMIVRGTVARRLS